MKWSFLAFIPKQTRRRRWTPCLIFLLEAPEWLAAGLNTGSSDKIRIWNQDKSTLDQNDWAQIWEIEFEVIDPGKTSWQRIVLCQFRQTSANSILQCVSWSGDDCIIYVDTSSLTMINSIHYLRHGLDLHRRHFWDAFPPTTPELAEKAKKMFETLQKFQSVKVRPFETEVERR